MKKPKLICYDERSNTSLYHFNFEGNLCYCLTKEGNKEVSVVKKINFKIMDSLNVNKEIKLKEDKLYFDNFEKYCCFKKNDNIIILLNYKPERKVELCNIIFNVK